MKENLWFIILNPAAGNGAAGKAWKKIETELQNQQINYTVKFTERSGHATQLADDALLKGYRKIMGIGGDGTNHEICNGILRQQWADSREILYALLPVGTGNDWAREWQIPHDPRSRLENLKAERRAWQDVGKVVFHKNGQPEERFFVNVAGMAYDAFIARRLAERPVGSKLQYLAMVAACLFEFKLAPAVVEFDNGGRIEDHFYTINIGVCRFSGGGMRLVPQALPDDGLLALTVARRLPKWEVLLQTPRFYNGTLLKHRKVEGFSVKKIRVSHPAEARPTLVEADGEFLGETPCEFSILEKALQICL